MKITINRATVEQALEALEDWDSPVALPAITALRTALAQKAEPVLQTCNCRWDGEVQVQQCTLHEAHIDAIHEWAERAKVAERKLAQQAEPVAYRHLHEDGWEYHDAPTGEDCAECQALYTAPPQQAEPVAGVVLNEEGRAALVEHGREEWHCAARNARRLYTAPPKDEPKPMHPELRKMWEDYFDKCFRAMPVPEQAEPVEPVAYIHRQGNYWDTSERHLTDDEKARGWTEEPLYTAPPQRKPLTIERLRDALVASRIIPPAAVEDPDGYDDGVTLYRIEALHRRIT